MKALCFVAGLLCGLLLAIGIACKAQGWVVGSGLAFHLGGEEHCHNHVTPGIGIEGKLYKSWDYALGLYSNSNCDTSLYGAAKNEPIEIYGVKLGYLLGGVSGYKNSITPVAGFGASIERRTWGLNAIYIPPYKGSGNVLWLQWKLPF